MDDDQVIRSIDSLVEEEHRLHSHVSAGTPLSDEDQRRLRELEVRLDQCWDLLRQRRGLRDRGENPDQAEVRDAGTVEGYRQ